MKRLVALSVIALTSELSANCDPVDSYTVAVEYNTLLERECSSLMGGGGVYYGKIVEASESSHVSCDGYSVAEGYVVIYGCNTCTSKNIQERLKQDTIACTKQCRKTMNNCVYDGMSNEWGGYYNTNQHPSCSLLKSTSLPGCAESSSSETVESSSSEFAESSSSEKIDSSSSEDENSSSSDGEECGTGTGHCPVSSSGSGKINSSSGTHGSGGGERGTQCYIGDEESCHPWSGIILFKRRPVVLGEIKLYGQQPYCREDGNIVFRAGIPIAYFRASSWLCLKEDCISYHSIEGFWECNEGSVQNNGCSAEPEHRSLPFYYSVQTGNLIASWGLKVDFSSTPESGMNLAYFDVNDLLNIVAREGVYVDGDDGLSYDLTDLYPQFSGNSFDDYVRACAYHLNIDVSSSSEVGSSSSSSSLFVLASSSSVQSSSSEESSSSIEESSSSENSSSSVEMEFSSSSDETESSSSNGNESSSSLGDEASSSSLQIESSSSEFVYSSSDDGCFVPGGDQVHSPNQIFSDCLDNMEPGKCYSINPDRGTQYGWMNTDAQDRWWWREVDCETGEKVDRNRVGACPGFPLDKVPSNPKQSCIAYNGKCYRCKSENSYVDCSQEWLWKWNFNEQNIGSWYAEVDCYNPFEDDEIITDRCIDESVLRKVSAREYYHDSDNAANDYSVVLTKHVKKYDALGRYGINKQPSHMALYQKNMSTPQWKIETSDILQIPSISSEDYCDRDSSGRWNCNKNKKGLKKRVWSVGEFVDPTRCNIKKGRDYWYFIKNTDPESGKVTKTYVGGVTCAWPNVSINHEPKPHKNELIYSNGKIVGVKATVEYRFYTHTTLGENNYIIMKAGDAFSDGHVVTSADEMCYEKHEQGHEKYNECVSYDEVEETGTFECTVKVSGAMSEDEMTKKINDAVIADLTAKRDFFEKQHLQDRLNKAQEKLDKSRDLFHADFGKDGYAGKNDKLPKSYVCPNF